MINIIIIIEYDNYLNTDFKIINVICIYVAIVLLNAFNIINYFPILR